MNVSCTSCSAKYAVPDEKVRGKKVKITCKHCGTGIIVDGTKVEAFGSTAPAAASLPPVSSQPEPVPAPAAAPAASSLAAPPVKAAKAATAPPTTLRWDIAYPDDRQETLDTSELVEKYAQGALDDDAFVWREGMTDWAAAFDIKELEAALTARGLKRKGAAVRATAASRLIDDDESTQVQASPFEMPVGSGSTSGGGAWREPAKEVASDPEAAFDLTSPAPLPFAVEKAKAVSPRPAAAMPKPAAAAPKPAASPAIKPSAARRNQARGGGDLFGDLASVGSEEDDSLGAEARDAGPKMTGARNESSVLFSLDALVKAEQPAPKKSAPKKEDAAAFLLGTDDAADSLANVGTGSFGSAFAPPDFTTPVQAPPPEVSRASDLTAAPSFNEPPTKKKGVGLWIALGAVVVLGGGAVALGLPAKLAGPKPEPLATAAPRQEPSLPVAAPEPTVAPAAAASSSPAAASVAGGTAGTAAVAATTPALAAKPTPKPDEASKPNEPSAKPVDKPAEPAAASDAPPFDKGAAVTALTAAAGNAQSCKTADGPTGSGKVSVTFMPSGRATNTQVSGDLAGTAVGGCVARIFRGSKIPAFSGEAVTVSKSFSVN